MTTEFSYLTFSVFEISDFILFVDTVKVIFKKQLITGKAEIYSEIPNPMGGLIHKVEAPIFPNLVAGKIRYIQTKLFLLSNYEDGLSNVCRIIQKHLRCNIITCALSNETETDNPFFKFYFPIIIRRTINSSIQRR